MLYSFNLFKWKSYFSRLYKLLLECQTNDDCSNASDTCHENICKCGSNAKCTGRTDNCTSGNCTCGQNNECSENQYCDLGDCKGMSVLIFRPSQILFDDYIFQFVLNFEFLCYRIAEHCSPNSYSCARYL